MCAAGTQDKLAVQAAAKQAAKEAGVAEEDEDDDEGGIIQVDEEMMRHREAAAALNAALHAPPTQVPCAPIWRCTVPIPPCSLACLQPLNLP